jgi:hypothetical protein
MTTAYDAAGIVYDETIHSQLTAHFYGHQSNTKD